MNYKDINWKALQEQLPELLGEVTSPIVMPRPIREVRKVDPHITDVERVSKCGWCLSHSYNGSGEYTYDSNTCDYFRACKRCLAIRAERFATRAARAIGQNKEKGITILVFEPGYERTIDFIRDTVTREDYLRMPMQDGGTALMLRTSEEILSENGFVSMCSEVINCKDIEVARMLNWEVWAKTPYRKAISGGLGEPEETKLSADVVTGIIDEITYCDAPADIMLEAIEYTIRETPDTPKTDDEVIPAINQRVAITVEYITSAGFSYKKVSRQRGVKIIRIINDDTMRIVWRTIKEGEQINRHNLVARYMDWLGAMAKLSKT